MNLTASQTDLALACAFPFRADIHVARTDNAASTKGTEEHERIASTIDGTEDADDTSETHARWLAEWWEGERGLAPWEAEVAIALNPRTGEVREVPRSEDGHRDYSQVPRGFIAGTADGRAWAPEGRTLRVVDWKSGQAEALKARALVRGEDGRMVARQVGWTRPTEMGQLLTLGAAFARLHRPARTSLEVVPVNERRLFHVAEPVALLDLRLHEDRLAAVLDEADGDAQPRPGPHCKALYCPLLGHCPATRAALAQAVPAVALSRFPIALHSADFVSQEHVAAQLALIAPARERIDAAELAAQMWVKTYGPATGADGHTWAPEPRSDERIDINAPGALDALKAALPETWERVLKTVTRTTASKDRIRDAVKPLVEAEKAAAKAAGGKVKHITIDAAQSRVVAQLAAVPDAVKRREWTAVVGVPPRIGRDSPASDGAADDAA